MQCSSGKEVEIGLSQHLEGNPEDISEIMFKGLSKALCTEHGRTTLP